MSHTKARRRLIDAIGGSINNCASSFDRKRAIHVGTLLLVLLLLPLVGVIVAALRHTVNVAASRSWQR